MIQLPDRLINETFDAQIGQSTVVRYRGLPLGSGVRNKFLVVLNRDCTQRRIYYFLTTSKTRFYQDHRKFRRFFVFVPKNAVSFFRQPTLIECRHPKWLDRNKLREKYRKHELTFEGVLPEQFMNNVIEIVRESELISPKVKGLILTP